MNVRNCRKCGKIFNYVAGAIVCPACREKMEVKFQEVKKYIQDNKNASIPEISKECEVEISQIHQWIREERLLFSDDSPIGLPCESCGTTIKSGRYCEKCKAELAAGLQNSIKQPKAEPQKKRDPRDNPKMRYLDR